MNGCEYCVAAHSFFGGKVGLDADDLLAARAGTLSGVAALARAVTLSRGQLSDAQLSAARDAGLNDEKIIDVIAQVSLLTLTNYLNNVAKTEIDFPPSKIEWQKAFTTGARVLYPRRLSACPWAGSHFR